MAISTLRIAAVVGLSAGLAACGGGSSSAPPPPPPPVVVVPPAPAPVEDSFGSGFGTRFRLGLNADATDPLPGDLNPLSLTTEATTI